MIREARQYLEDAALHVALGVVGGVPAQRWQERGARAGTENAPAIAAFGAVCANVKALGQEASRLSFLREAFELGLKRLRPDAIIFGAAAERLANTSLFAIPDAPAEMLLIALDLGGVAVSSGAACSSGKVKSSHVLRAMGVEEGAAAAVRVSLGWTTQEADVEAVLVVLADVLGRLQVRRMQRAA